MKYLLSSLFSLFIIVQAFSQGSFPTNGPVNPDKSTYAITKAQIYTDYKTIIENGTIIFREGKIIAVGSGIKIPADAVIYELPGKVVYPSFIDPYADYGLQEIKLPEIQTANYLSSKSGAYNWNEAIRPEYRAADAFQPNGGEADQWLKNGFGAVLSLKFDGVMRGSGTLVFTGKDKAQQEMLMPDAAFLLAFDKGSSKQAYPSSLTGMIALLRQTYFDARWYASNGNTEERNLSLEALNKFSSLPAIFECKEKYDIFRADKIGKEFGISYIFKGNGDEYQRASEIKKIGAQLIIPMELPEAYDLSDPFDARSVSLSELKHAELAPYNAFYLSKEGIPFAFTLRGLKDKNTFLARIRKFVKCGLSPENALKALTYEPARILKAETHLGSIAVGKSANFIVASGNIFDEKSKIHENYVAGRRYVIENFPGIDLSGTHSLILNKSLTLKWSITSEAGVPKSEIFINDTLKVKCDIKLNGKLITLITSHADFKGTYRLSGVVNPDKSMKGSGENPAGQKIVWESKFVSANAEEKKPEDKTQQSEPGKIWYPFLAYGSEEVAKTGKFLIKNATIWTNEKEAVLSNTDLLIENGKISKIGKNLANTEAIVIDGTGKHLTSGIIDEHSHIAMTRGVNEAGTAVSSEVRMGDVINPDDINIYRHLAGGVTAVQQLHGSANPVGGQSSVIKLRWGAMPEEMKILDADGFIKFALGENVKQSNWGPGNTWRYPQSRPGVEQTYYHYFLKALEYEKELKEKGDKARRDLKLECLLEILNKKRFITCHSYVQSEINMLMKVADSLGFKVNTFTHILEGYKVADKMKDHGVGASTFSDWWAYKWEVNDAIPYNASIMTKVGVVTAMNSDDAEMARRLNQEAGKNVKYGGMSKEEAWKTVTLNPAILLHLDKQTGSIKVGKDADLVLWDEEPLSIYARAEKTFVDGILYFDLKKDEELRKKNAEERTRLIQKMMSDPSAKTGKKPEKKEQHLYHCEDLTDEDVE